MSFGLRRTLAVLLAVVALSGCDVALIAYFAGKDDSPKAAAAPDLRYRIYVRNIGATDLGSVNTALIGVTTPPAPWIYVGTSDKTKELDLTPHGADTVLLWNLERQAYRVDAIEEISAGGSTLRTAPSADLRSDDISSEIEAGGYPDGVTTTLAVTPTGVAHLFAKFSSTLGRVRINAFVAPGAGDVINESPYGRTNLQIAGGVGLSASGEAYVSFMDAATRNVQLIRFDAAGTEVGSIMTIENTTNASVGTPCVLVDNTLSFVYIGSTIGNGDIKVKQYGLAMNLLDAGFFDLATGSVEFLEWNGLASDSSGNVTIAGALTGSGFDHYVVKVNSTGAGVWGGPPTPPTDSGNSGWYGVACDTAGHVFLAGDITEGGGPTNRELLARRVTSAGANDWTHTETNAGQVDRGHAVVASNGSVWIGGFKSTGGLKDAVILKLSDTGTPAGGVFPLVHAGAAAGDDEILDLAVDADGFIFAVGYETHEAAARGKDWWVRKIDPTGTIEWTRTYHHGETGGDDRAVSIAIVGDIVVVSGEVAVAGPSNDIHVRRYHR